MAAHWFELWRIVGLALLALVLGWMVGAPLVCLLIAAAAYIAWSLFNLRRLLRYLRGGEATELPAASGWWGEAFDELYRQQRRNRRRRQRARELINRFRESTDAMPDGTVVTDDEGVIQWWNQTAASLFGLHAPRDTGQRISNLVRHPRFVSYMDRGEFSRPVVFPAPVDSSRSLSVTVVPYGNQQRLLMIRDITRELRLEGMRRDFVANISHELRTPLTVIAGFVETLRTAEDECAARWGRTLELMQQQSDRMTSLVEDLLTLARLEHSEAPAEAIVPVPDLLEALHREAGALSGGRGHRIALESDPNLYLRGAARELDSAFKNLITNAVHYTPAGGEISIRWWGDAEGAHFAVKDSGIGIAAQHIPRLTERFYRVEAGRSRESGGTGLGLAIVKHVLMRHGGRLEIQSRPREGSLFVCHFPPERVLSREHGLVS